MNHRSCVAATGEWSLTERGGHSIASSGGGCRLPNQLTQAASSSKTNSSLSDHCVSLPVEKYPSSKRKFSLKLILHLNKQHFSLVAFCVHNQIRVCLIFENYLIANFILKEHFSYKKCNTKFHYILCIRIFIFFMGLRT